MSGWDHPDLFSHPNILKRPFGHVGDSSHIACALEEVTLTHSQALEVNLVARGAQRQTAARGELFPGQASHIPANRKQDVENYSRGRSSFQKKQGNIQRPIIAKRWNLALLPWSGHGSPCIVDASLPRKPLAMYRSAIESHVICHDFPAVMQDPDFNVQFLWWLKISCEIQI